jgi:tetratricopeptide (TPR) repeat protein
MVLNDMEQPQNVTEDPSSFKELGNDAFKKEDFNEAVQFYTKAIRLGEKHKELPVYYKNRAAAYLKLENYEQAREDCNKCLEFTPNDQKALFRRAQGRIV